MATETVREMQTSIFADKRVILVHGGDERCAGFWDESETGFEQSFNTPTHLIIGRAATDDAVKRVQQRFPVYSLEELIAFRDAHSPIRQP